MTERGMPSGDLSHAADWESLGPVEETPGEAGATLPERIASRVEELVGAGRIAPGDRLPAERELARIFDVSRPSVREAVHRLEARGVVVVKRGAGVFVARQAAAKSGPRGVAPSGVALPSSSDVAELFDVRRLLEPAAAEWAALLADHRAVASLRRIAERFDDAAGAAERPFDVLAEYDVQLHLEVAHCAENHLLERLVEQLQDLLQLQLEWSLRRPGRLAETTAEHRRLVDAIAQRRPQAAREAMLTHLDAADASFRAATAAAVEVD